MTSPVAPPLAHRRKRTKTSRETSPALAGPVKSDSAPTKSADAAESHSGDESSELSESSEEPSDLSSSEDEDEESTKTAAQAPKEPEVVNLRANRGQKPTYKLDEEELGPDIRTFLKDFLPKLKAANEELEADRKQGTLKKREIDAVDGEEDEQYIEMNLGLGVLKMKDADQSSESGSDTDMSDGDDDTKEKDVLGKLMGQEKAKEPAGIQEVSDKQGS
ncbi:hypothetical protein OPT61_g3810 [Boeremia exigua]|uniref:Uncharacterized protein n=1 Tax=Boeremia exigua TaxID=749465 RepID=A0ACC2IGH9_9PLEO|nr:hypothetical protein OPT61_g3810 [Boeremia exigua]